MSAFDRVRAALADFNFGLLAMKEAHYAFAERYQRPIESAPESVREAFEAAWVMSRAVAIADSARVCKTWKEVCQSARRHGAACGADECMKLVAIQDED